MASAVFVQGGTPALPSLAVAGCARRDRGYSCEYGGVSVEPRGRARLS